MKRRKAIEAARILRKNQTESESIVWDLVKNRGLLGKRILRQHPIEFQYYGRRRFFIADFYCPDKKLVIEIDGAVHENQKEYDELRDFIMNELGYKVLRIRNEETEDVEELINKLKAYLK